MPLIATRGAASAQGFGEFAQTAVATYIEDVFSTYLYTATGPSSGQTITNNIDLSGKGGMLWIKDRTDAGTYPVVVDTARGANKWIYTSSTAAEATSTSSVTSFTSSGFVLGTDSGSGDSNSVNYAYSSPSNYVSWAFRKQPKFFDVVTYTGNGSNRTISHNLGSVPGCMIIKSISGTNAGIYSWAVYHRSLNASGLGPQGSYIFLNDTSAQSAGSDYWNSTNPTSTQFSLGSNGSVNNNGTSYIAYLFAHDAGGFGTSGSDNVISCGSFTTDGSGNATVSLGYEPQWLLIRRISGVGSWQMFDNMRGLPVGAAAARLDANSSNGEANGATTSISATGFTIATNASSTFIYIAIRRGPMKTPEAGTEVFSPVARTGTGANATITAGFAPDLVIDANTDRAGTNYNPVFDKLRGINALLSTNNNGAEQSLSGSVTGFTNTGITVGSDAYGNINGPYPYINWFFQRAPGFFDVVCYTGNDVNRTISHNLGVAPEMMIVKCRDSALDWAVYHSGVGNTKYLWLNSTAAEATASTYWNNTTPTSSVFTVGTSNKVNSSPSPYVAYLFASVTGVSKVGTYTGSGTTKQIDCGFTNGSRFVLIKRTDSTGSWYVWDSARGIVAGNDPYLLWNSTSVEVTSTDYIDTYSAGFEISSTAPAEINANGGTFIFLAIA